MGDIKDTLKQLILDAAKLNEFMNIGDMSDTEPIHEEGLGLDSIEILQLLVLVENEFEISVIEEGIDREMFDSFNAFHNHIESLINENKKNG